jgi:hypothetical protein
VSDCLTWSILQVARAAGVSMQARNEDSKLFVGGLPWALDSEDLREVLF